MKWSKRPSSLLTAPRTEPAELEQRRRRALLVVLCCSSAPDPVAPCSSSSLPRVRRHCPCPQLLLRRRPELRQPQLLLCRRPELDGRRCNGLLAARSPATSAVGRAGCAAAMQGGAAARWPEQGSPIRTGEAG